MADVDWNAFSDTNYINASDWFLMTRGGVGMNVSGDTFIRRVSSGDFYGAKGASGVAVELVFSLDPGSNGINVRDVQLRAGNDGSNNTYIDFYTSKAASPTPKVRIDADGRFLVGTSTPSIASDTHFARFHADLTSQWGIGISSTQVSGTARMQRFIFNGSAVGSITSTASATVYATSSDERLKNVEGPVTGSGAFIDALEPECGTWKVDGSPFVGFVAHKLQKVSPTSVVGEPFEVRPERSFNVTTGKEEITEIPVYQSVQSSSPEIMANIIAELQALRRRVAMLEAQPI